MLKKRIIPIQLLSKKRLNKTKQFAKPVDVGDPIKSSKIYNDQEADELILLDIDRDKQDIENLCLIVKEIAKNIFIPFSVGGGVKTYQDAKKLFDSGADKVVINSLAYRDLGIIKDITNNYGSQSVIISIDVRGDNVNNYKLYSNCGTLLEKISLLNHLKQIKTANIGEIIVQSIDHDGMMNGYNFELIKYCILNTDIPFIAASGAGNFLDLKEAFDYGADAVACGSLFNFGDNNPIRAKAFLKNYNIPLKRLK